MFNPKPKPRIQVFSSLTLVKRGDVFSWQDPGIKRNSFAAFAIVHREPSKPKIEQWFYCGTGCQMKSNEKPKTPQCFCPLAWCIYLLSMLHEYSCGKGAPLYVLRSALPEITHKSFSETVASLSFPCGSQFTQTDALYPYEHLACWIYLPSAL